MVFHKIPQGGKRGSSGGVSYDIRATRLALPTKRVFSLNELIWYCSLRLCSTAIPINMMVLIFFLVLVLITVRRFRSCPGVLRRDARKKCFFATIPCFLYYFQSNLHHRRAGSCLNVSTYTTFEVIRNRCPPTLAGRPPGSPEIFFG